MIAAPLFRKQFPTITGVPAAHFNGVYRNAREASLIPSCSGSTVAELDGSHAASLIFAALADVPAHKSAKAAMIYRGLKDSNGKTAGEELERIFASFRPSNGDLAYAALSYRAYVVMDLEVPRVTIVRECGNEPPYIQVFGIQRSKSSETLIQHSKTISGKVLFELASILNSDYWASKKHSDA